MRAAASTLAWSLLLGVWCGCTSVPMLRENPIVVGGGPPERVWESAVEVIDDYFDIALENHFENHGVIETLPQTGATLLEPWRADSIGFDQRAEASLQTIRRRCFVYIRPAPNGGTEIAVEVYKELEDLRRPIFSAHNGGTFIQSIQPSREAVVTPSIKASDGWISLGRDERLESILLEKIYRRIGG